MESNNNAYVCIISLIIGIMLNLVQLFITMMRENRSNNNNINNGKSSLILSHTSMLLMLVNIILMSAAYGNPISVDICLTYWKIAIICYIIALYCMK